MAYTFTATVEVEITIANRYMEDLAEAGDSASKIVQDTLDDLVTDDRAREVRRFSVLTVDRVERV